MLSFEGVVALQAATPTPGVGPDELVDYWPLVRRAGWFAVGLVVTIVVGWYAVEPAVSRVVRRRNRNNPTLQDALSRYVRLVVVLVALLVGAGVAGYGQFLSNSAIVVAAATLAVGVAAQSVVGSFVSGIVLVLDPEFNVGNYIRVGETEGIVQSITLRVTRVQTFDGGLVTVPNTALTSQAISRPYGRSRFRVVEYVGLAYEDDVDEGIRLIEAAAAAHDGVLAEPAPAAYVDEFGSDAVVLRVHYWIENPRRKDVFEVRSAVAREVKSRLEGAGITISPPSKRELLGRVGVDESTDGA